MPDYIFKTPTIDEGTNSRTYPFNYFKQTKGISIYKSGGVYAQIRYPSDDNIPDYTEFYLGGGTHTVTSAIRAALIAADIGISSDNFTAI